MWCIWFHHGTDPSGELIREYVYDFPTREIAVVHAKAWSEHIRGWVTVTHNGTEKASAYMGKIAPYTTRGPVMGDCGHRHRTIESAERCLHTHRNTFPVTDRQVIRAPM